IQAFDQARMKIERIRVSHFHLGVSILHRVSEIEQPVALCLPPAIDPGYIPVAHAEQSDRAHHSDAPWVNHALYLYHLAAGTVHRDIEKCLAGLGKQGVLVFPVAESARAIATDVNPL